MRPSPRNLSAGLLAFVALLGVFLALSPPATPPNENGYTCFDMHPDFENEFSKYKCNYPEGGPGSFEYQFPRSLIPRFNDLTLGRTWMRFE